MQEHQIFENQQAIIPEIAVENSNSKPQQSQLVILLNEQSLSNLPEFIKAQFQNQALLQHLQEKGTVTLYDQNQAQIVLFTKDTSNPSTAFAKGRAQHKIIQQNFSNSYENLVIYVASEITQNYLNEYLYGFFIQNYEWQRKSYPGQQQSANTSLFIQFRKLTLHNTQFNPSDERFVYLKTIAGAKLYSKQLNNTRAHIADTDYMYNQAKQFQQQNSEKVKIHTLYGEEVKNAGLTLMYAVGQGSDNPQILVTLEYNGNPQSNKKVALVGKGVVYDCGGLSLKRAGTERMHGDKGGACTCFGIFKAIVELNLQINAICTLSLVQNSISENAYRNSDIYSTYKGITVEIHNTDAEGRNILADSMSYVQDKFKPTTLIDIATLTGACAHALGQTVQAVFTNSGNQRAQKVMEYSDANHEPVWHLPITEFMRENMKGDQGDIRNAGKQPWGGSGCAAAFLENFVEQGVEWFHFDIAPSNQIKGEGQPVRTIVDFLKSEYQN